MSKLAWPAIPLLWTAVGALGVLCALALPLNLVLVPCWLACAGSVGALSRRILDPHCEGCGEPRGSASGAADVARRATGPAHERAMERALVGEA